MKRKIWAAVFWAAGLLCGCVPRQTAPTETAAPFVWQGKTVADKDSCGFYIQKGSWTEAGDYRMKVTCRNSTESLCMFSMENILVDGYLVSPFWGTEVASMSIENHEILIDRETLAASGVTAGDEIRFELRIFDLGNMPREYLWRSEETVYPTGMNQNRVTKPAPPKWSEERIFADNSDCGFRTAGTMEQGSLRCYLENKAGEPLQFTWYNTYADGEPLEPFWSVEIPAHSRCCTQIPIPASGPVQELEFHLYVFKNSRWFGQAVVNEVFVWTPL